MKDPRLAGLRPEKEDEEPAPRRQRPARSPDSAGGLAHFWAEEVLVKGKRVGGRREDIARKFLAAWIRRGVPPAVLREMIKIFCADRQLLDSATPWKTFVSHAPTLQQKAERSLKVASVLTYTYDDVPADLLALLEEEAS